MGSHDASGLVIWRRQASPPAEVWSSSSCPHRQVKINRQPSINSKSKFIFGWSSVLVWDLVGAGHIAGSGAPRVTSFRVSKLRCSTLRVFRKIRPRRTSVKNRGEKRKNSRDIHRKSHQLIPSTFTQLPTFLQPVLSPKPWPWSSPKTKRIWSTICAR